MGSENSSAASAAILRAPRLEFIDGCRGIAVLLVLIFHAMMSSETKFPKLLDLAIATLGRSGVDLFLVLSGFCLTWPLVNRAPGRIGALNLPQFAWRRIKRIVPPYYFALGVVAVAHSLVIYWCGLDWWMQRFHNLFPLPMSDEWKNVASHLLLIHGFTPYHGSIDGAFWSLSLEWQFYFLFPPLIWVARRWGVGPAFLLTCIVTLGFRAAIRAWDAGLVWHALYNETAPARWCEFGAGIYVAYLVACNKPSQLPTRLLDVLALAVGIGSIGFTLLRSGFFLIPIIWGFTAALFILAASRPDGWIGRTMRLGLIKSLGEISYSLYLLHGTVFMLLGVLLSRLDAGPLIRIVAFYGPGLALAIGCAALSYRWIEAPFLHTGKKKTTSRASEIQNTVPSAS